MLFIKKHTKKKTLYFTIIIPAIIISIAGYPRTAKTHLENDILPSPTIDLTQLQLRKDLKFKGFNKITTHYTSLHITTRT